MRYVSEEERELKNICDKYLEKDSKGKYYLPDDVPQEAKEAYEKVQQMILDREMKESGWF